MKMSITGDDVTAYKPDDMAFTSSIASKDAKGTGWSFLSGEDYPLLNTDIRNYNKMPR